MRESWREVGQEIIFQKTKVKKVENYFANKEINVFHFCENLKTDCFANLNDKNIKMKNLSGKLSKPSCQKKIIFLKE